MSYVALTFFSEGYFISFFSRTKDELEVPGTLKVSGTISNFPLNFNINDINVGFLGPVSVLEKEGVFDSSTGEYTIKIKDYSFDPNLLDIHVVTFVYVALKDICENNFRTQSIGSIAASTTPAHWYREKIEQFREFTDPAFIIAQQAKKDVLQSIADLSLPLPILGIFVGTVAGGILEVTLPVNIYEAIFNMTPGRLVGDSTDAYKSLKSSWNILRQENGFIKMKIHISDWNKLMAYVRRIVKSPKGLKGTDFEIYLHMRFGGLGELKHVKETITRADGTTYQVSRDFDGKFLNGSEYIWYEAKADNVWNLYIDSNVDRSKAIQQFTLQKRIVEAKNLMLEEGKKHKYVVYSNTPIPDASYKTPKGNSFDFKTFFDINDIRIEEL